MATQSYKNHAHRPVATLVGGLFVLAALVAFAMRWYGTGGRTTFAVGLLALVGAVSSLLYMSRVYITKLQDRIIRLEMRVRGASVLTPEQQRLLSALSMKQTAALRFASDAELPALVERTAREQLTPAAIKRAVSVWVADFDRT
jgi:hypothetical protein